MQITLHDRVRPVLCQVHRHNIELTILPKKIEDLREVEKRFSSMIGDTGRHLMPTLEELTQARGLWLSTRPFASRRVPLLSALVQRNGGRTWWGAHRVHRINTTPTILSRRIED